MRRVSDVPPTLGRAKKSLHILAVRVALVAFVSCIYLIVRK